MNPTKVLLTIPITLGFLITDAGGEALNMQRARHVIYYNRPFDPGTYIQILGRARRFGAVHNHLVAWHLSAKDTVDELVDSILTAKFGPFDEIVRNRGTLMPESESLPLEVARRARQARIHRNHS
jgi:superfamily II DNA/RNA helicase